MAFNYCTLNSANKLYIIYILVFLCVLIAIYLYATINSNNRANTANTYYANPRNKRDGSNDLWYGLNAGGDYRGYGREYAGHLSPGRIYGNGTQ